MSLRERWSGSAGYAGFSSPRSTSSWAAALPIPLWLEPTVSSYGEGVWLAFSSAATVGYGDYYPTTPASRIFSVFIVLPGYAALSLVTAAIAAFFIGEEEKELRRELHHDMRALRNEITELQSDLRALRPEKPAPD